MLAAIVGSGFAGCRANPVQPADAGSGAAAKESVSLGSSADAVAPASAMGEMQDAAPSHPRPPPTRWALWPIPNFAASGLPNPQSYDLSTGGTVLDRVTGLMWQRKIHPENGTFDDALAQCERLELGGYHDWRLPSRIELVTILDLAETQPSIERDAFPFTPSDWFWTSSVAADSPTEAWYVYFYFGYPKTDERRSLFRIRCVRTENPPAFSGDPETHYEVSASTVHDRATGLTWQRDFSPTPLTFPLAQAYCTHLNGGAHGAWRVPSMPELESLIDERTTKPAIDRTAFPATPPEPFWTSSLFGNKSAEAWQVYFDSGQALYGLLKGTHRVRCVH